MAVAEEKPLEDEEDGTLQQTLVGMPRGDHTGNCVGGRLRGTTPRRRGPDRTKNPTTTRATTEATVVPVTTPTSRLMGGDPTQSYAITCAFKTTRIVTINSRAASAAPTLAVTGLGREANTKRAKAEVKSGVF
jgi:hypothetical protein